jgi:hypothetical protein
MHALHTAGVPPRRGRTILPIIGCTTKRSVALTNSVVAYRRRIGIRGEILSMLGRSYRERDQPE